MMIEFIESGASEQWLSPDLGVKKLIFNILDVFIYAWYSSPLRVKTSDLMLNIEMPCTPAKEANFFPPPIQAKLSIMMNIK